MGKVIVVTGNAMSGKSRWATSYFKGCDNVQYLCTKEDISEGLRNRITHNEELRNVKWDVYKDFDVASFEKKEGCSNFILDDVRNYIFKEYAKSCVDVDTDFKKAYATLEKMLSAIKSEDGNIIVITTEDNDNSYTRNVLALVNQRLAGFADEVYLSVCGIQMKIK